MGIAVAGQTFYSFILENLSNLGALKAMGANNLLLCKMLFFQAFCAGLIGYGIGFGTAGAFGFLTAQAAQFPYYMPYQVPLFVFVLILLICFTSALIAVRKISRVDPSEVFRV